MDIKLVKFKPEHQSAFKSLNKAWIDQYFVMEETDYKSLDQPEEYILSKGGEIIVALADNKVAGVCALIKMNHQKYGFELAKMAVDPAYRGKGIGEQLGKAVLDMAGKKGASHVYLESNTILAPAIKLYRKLGFTEVTGEHTPYSRCNIQMEVEV